MHAGYVLNVDFSLVLMLLVSLDPILSRSHALMPAHQRKSTSKKFRSYSGQGAVIKPHQKALCLKAIDRRRSANEAQHQQDVKGQIFFLTQTSRLLTQVQRALRCSMTLGLCQL